MKPFIFGKRNGVHIIDLQKTLQLFKEAVDFLTQLAAQGKTVLFVGTKSQAQETVEEEARRCGMYWVNNRWLGGLLTNFPTIQTSIKRYRELESMRENGHYEKLSKKEVARLERERKKLEKNLLGIKDIERCPDALFVVDSRQETIAIREAAKLKIPIVAIVDTNSDPDLIDYLIPGNDDALRAIKLFAGTMADAILAGKAVYSTRLEAEMKEAQEKADKVAKEAAQRQAAKEAKEAAQHAAEGKEAVETGAAAVAVPVAALPVEESTGVKPAPAQEMKKEEKKEEKKEVPKKKTLAKKAKSETEKSKSIQAAKEKKTKKKSEKSASKTRKTASAKSKSTKSPAKSKTRKETTSKDSSASSGSSS